MYTFLLSYCSFYCLVSPHFVYIFRFIFIPFLSIEACSAIAESSIFFIFIASERFLVILICLILAARQFLTRTIFVIFDDNDKLFLVGTLAL